MTPSPFHEPMHVVEPLAAGLDVHKLQITAGTRRCPPDGGEPLCATCEFATTSAGLAALTDWLLDQQVDAVAIEGRGVYWEPPHTALESAGLRVSLYNAQQVKHCDSQCEVSYAVWQTVAFAAIKGWLTLHFPFRPRISATVSASGRANRASVPCGPFPTNSRGNRPSSAQFRTVPGETPRVAAISRAVRRPQLAQMLGARRQSVRVQNPPHAGGRVGSALVARVALAAEFGGDLFPIAVGGPGLRGGVESNPARDPRSAGGPLLLALPGPLRSGAGARYGPVQRCAGNRPNQRDLTPAGLDWISRPS